MKTLDFYKVYDWMRIVANGYNEKTGLLAMIYSFQESRGEPCKASTQELADFCGCTRRKIFKDLRFLLEHGFISAQKTSRTGIVAYIVNVENCKAYEPCSQDAEELMNAVHKSYEQNSQAYERGSQELMNEVHTHIIENSYRESHREGKRSGKAAAPPTLDEVSKYFKEIGCTESACVFHSYYAARSWQGISDWKAAAMNWMQRGQQRSEGAAPQRPATKPAQPQNSSITPEMLMQLQSDLDRKGIL